GCGLAGGNGWLGAGEQAEAGDGDVVAGGFGLVHHGVGGTDDGGNAVSVLGEGGQTKAAGESEEETLAGEEAGLAKLLPEAHGGVDGGLLFQAGEQGDELVAAVAEAGVGGAEGAPHEAADLGQQAASDEVAVGVVDQLEVVE